MTMIRAFEHWNKHHRLQPITCFNGLDYFADNMQQWQSRGNEIRFWLKATQRPDRDVPAVMLRLIWEGDRPRSVLVHGHYRGVRYRYTYGPEYLTKIHDFMQMACNGYMCTAHGEMFIADTERFFDGADTDATTDPKPWLRDYATTTDTILDFVTARLGSIIFRNTQEVRYDNVVSPRKNNVHVGLHVSDSEGHIRIAAISISLAKEFVHVSTGREGFPAIVRRSYQRTRMFKPEALLRRAIADARHAQAFDLAMKPAQYGQLGTEPLDIAALEQLDSGLS